MSWIIALMDMIQIFSVALHCTSWFCLNHESLIETRSVALSRSSGFANSSLSLWSAIDINSLFLSINSAILSLLTQTSAISSLIMCCAVLSFIHISLAISFASFHSFIRFVISFARVLLSIRLPFILFNVNIYRIVSNYSGTMRLEIRG